MNFKIEKNIPIPTQETRWSFLKELEIGDSFVIEKKHRINVYTRAKNFKIKILARRVDNNKHRVWRVK